MPFLFSETSEPTSFSALGVASALCNLMRVGVLWRISQSGESAKTPICSAPGLADVLCNPLAWPAATLVSARPVQRSVYSQCYLQ